MIYDLDLVEVRDDPKERVNPDQEEKGEPTVGLLIWLYKLIWGTGGATVLDS